MIDQKQLADAFALNVRIMKSQAEGLSHADSLRQPPFRGNCLNWVLGHLLLNRNRVLAVLGQEPVLDGDTLSRYETGSEPVTGDEDGILTLEELLDGMVAGQEKIAAGLQQASAEDLAQEIQAGERTMTLGRRLFGLYFHDTYHTGQTEMLRQLAGADDKVI